MQGDVAQVAVFCLLGLVLLAGLLREEARRDRIGYLQERCRLHLWSRGTGGRLVCAACGWVAGQREAVHPLGGSDE